VTTIASASSETSTTEFSNVSRGFGYVAAESFQERGDTDASAALNGFGEEVQQAIEEVRAFARGVYPLLLASEGLGAALVSASRHAAPPITVSARAGYAAAGPTSRARSTSPA
jgi:hypothetical protein